MIGWIFYVPECTSYGVTLVIFKGPYLDVLRGEGPCLTQPGCGRAISKCQSRMMVISLLFGALRRPFPVSHSFSVMLST